MDEREKTSGNIVSSGETFKIYYYQTSPGLQISSPFLPPVWSYDCTPPPIRVPHHLSNASCYTHVHKVFFVSSPIKLGIKKNIIQSDCGALSLSAFLHHLCEAVGDAEGGVNESLHAAHQARLCPVVQLWARSVHTFIPADVGETVHLQTTGHRRELIQLSVIYRMSKHRGWCQLMFIKKEKAEIWLLNTCNQDSCRTLEDSMFLCVQETI